MDSIIALNLFEIQKYLVLTNHVFSAGWAQLSEKVWQDLTPETRKVWLETWKEVAEGIKREMIDKEQEYISIWKSKGSTVINPDIEAFREATKEVWKKFAPEAWGPGVYEKIKAMR